MRDVFTKSVCCLGCSLFLTQSLFSQQNLRNVPYSTTDDSLASLREDFSQPSPKQRPETWFHLIGGNVDQGFLTSDLEAVEGAGFQGIHLFHGRGRAWPGVKPQIQTLSPTWDSLISHVADETERLGLRFTMQNCPGWAMSGGPWITPDKAMRHLVASRTETAGGQPVSLALPVPQPSEEEWRDYQDVAVLAFPTPEGDTAQFLSPRSIRSSNPDLPWDGLLAGEKDVQVELPASGEETWVEFEFDQGTSLRSVELPPVEVLMARRNFIPETSITVQASADSADSADSEWQDLITHEVPYANWQDRQLGQPFVLAVPESKAKRYRLVFRNNHAMAFPFLRLSSLARVHDWRAQAGLALRKIFREGQPEPAPKTVVDPANILDLSEHFQSDGQLTWTPPPGRWTILRLGHVNTGTKNKPAPPEATGFECNKFAPEAAELHFKSYIGRVSAEGGPADGGRLQGMLIDSWECYTQSWTPRMEQEFEQRRGYALRPWLPALSGYVMGDRFTTERFLRDWRLTISDLLVENYFGRLGELARERGMQLYFETAIGDVSPGDILRYQSKADIPMCEFWQPNDPHWGGYEAKPVHPTVSAAHIYGKNRIAAEAFTNVDHDWSDHPFTLKHMADRNFALGINHLVFHTYTHNPLDKVPGTSFGNRIGSPFIRGQTWWKHMPLFTDYLSRCQTLLQQGNPVADVLWYLGDDLNHRPRQDEPFPEGYDFDYLNQDVLLNRLEVVDGKLRSPEGLTWEVLWLPEQHCQRLTPETLARLLELIEAGATVVGGPPRQNPSLVNGAEADQRFESLVKTLWQGKESGDRAIQKGRLLWGLDLGSALESLAIEPDVRGLRPLSWNHRRAGEKDIYFITADRATALDATVDFRATGSAEFWDPLHNTVTPVTVFATEEGRTRIPIQLPAAGSVFVIFREGEAAPGITRIAHEGQTLVDANDLARKDEGAPYPHIGLQKSELNQPWVNPAQPKFEVTDQGSSVLAYAPGSYEITMSDGTSHSFESTASTQSLEGPWQLTFPKKWVVENQLEIASPKSWTLFDDPEVRAFSGSANYETTFQFEKLKDDQRAILDLGRVANIARIRLNGKDLATLWAPPFQIDLSAHLQEGENQLEIEVTNTWHNRLVHDASLPAKERRTWTYSGPKPDSEPKPAGLLGPVSIHLAENKSLTKETE